MLQNLRLPLIHKDENSVQFFCFKFPVKQQERSCCNQGRPQCFSIPLAAKRLFILYYKNGLKGGLKFLFLEYVRIVVFPSPKVQSTENGTTRGQGENQCLLSLKRHFNHHEQTKVAHWLQVTWLHHISVKNDTHQFCKPHRVPLLDKVKPLKNYFYGEG